MAAAAGNISFAHAHLYASFSIPAATPATWAALKTAFPVGTYINQTASVTLPVQTANTIDVQNMGAQSTQKLPDLPTLSDSVIEVGWVNDNAQIALLRNKTVNDDIAVALVLNTDDDATKANPLDDSTAATAAYFAGQIASVEPVPPVPGTRAMVRVTIAANAKVVILDQA